MHMRSSSLLLVRLLPAAGITGGFAGGEEGLKQFVRDGELRLRQPGDPRKVSSSPVAWGGLLLLLGGGGAVLLTDTVDLGEGLIKDDVLQVRWAGTTAAWNYYSAPFYRSRFPPEK